MWPAQTSEVEDHSLRILDLGGIDGDRRGDCNFMRRFNFEDWDLSARVRSWWREL
jgi:hypothetical protein